MAHARLLELDGIGNVLLGLPLLLFPGPVLAGWLVLADVELPARGLVVLSSLAVILVGISLAEALSLTTPKRA